MKSFLFEILKEAFSQIMGFDLPHEGKLVLTRNTLAKMREYNISQEDVQDVFRFGEHRNKGEKFEVIRSYNVYSIGLWYKVIYTTPHWNVSSEKRFLIITCWKGGETHYVRV